MIDDLLILGFAVFAVAAAVARTEMFTWLRNRGRAAYLWPRPWFYLATPLRASLCPLCFSFWAAAPAPWLPVAPELEGVGRILLWLGPVGVSALLAHLTAPSEPPMLQFPDLDDVGPYPDAPTDVAHQTATEPA